MTYLGDWVVGSTHDFKFNTAKISDGSAVTLAGTPSLAAYKANGTTEDTDGLTLSVDFDGVTGLHNVRVDLSADGTFYAAGSEIEIVIAAGTVDTVSVVGRLVATFSIEKTTALRPTTAGRTLNVAADGDIGGNVDGSVASVAAGGISTASFVDGALTAAKFASGAFDAVWSVATRILTAGTNIVLAKGTGVTGFNDVSPAQVNAEVDTAIADAALATAAALATTDGKADAIKNKTDSLTFTTAGQVDSNVQYVNDIAVNGSGTSGDPWGP